MVAPLNKRELEEAISKEVEHWPGIVVEFKAATGGNHPKAKFTFDGKMLARPYASTPSDSMYGLHQCLGDMRRVMKQLGAVRDKPEPSREEDEAPYRKPNNGAAVRPDPVKGEKATPKPTVAEQLGLADQAGTARVDIPQPASEVPADTAVGTVIGVECDGVAKVRVGRAHARDLAAEIVDGIYFDLSMEVYREVPRLGASSLQALNVSAGDFWARSWLNPERDVQEDGDEEEEEKKAEHLVTGEAYHCARLEPDQFAVRYARSPAKADYPAKGLLTSDAAVKAKLKELGEQQTVTGETTADRCQRLLNAGYDGTIFPLVKATFLEQLDGRVPLAGHVWDEIVRDMERLHANKEVAALLEHGFSEVSVFWTDANNIQRKARFDRLTYEHWADFKTFDNPRGKRLERALSEAVQYNRYYLTAASYLEASDAIRTGGLQVISEATDEQLDLIAKLQIKPEQQKCWFVFQQKKGVPNVLAYEFVFYDVPDDIENIWDTGANEEAQARGHAATRRPTLIYQKGKAEIDYAKRLFALYSGVYPPGDPWAPVEPLGKINDSSFNPKWLEGMYD